MRIVYLLFLLVPLLVRSQVVTGRVVNENGQPLSNATVSLLRAGDSTAFKYILSDVEGTFQFVVDTMQPLRLQVSFAGYRRADTTVYWTAEDTLKLQPFVLYNANNKLSAVKVAAGRPLFEVKADKIVFNVSQNIARAGGTALELLQKAPGVLVDKDDNIALNGKNGVRVYLDGRPSPLSLSEMAALLRTLPATDVEAIEIITNPSARYEAAGNAGVLNIVFKKNKSLGTNGTLNTGWAVAVFPKYNAGISLNHRTKMLNVFGNFSHQQSTNQSYLSLFRYQNDSIYDQRSQTVYQSKSDNAKLGADFFLSKTKTLGVLLNGNFSETTSTTDSRTPIGAQKDNLVAQSLYALSNGQQKRTNLSANVNYRNADTAGRVLSLDADYSYYNLNGFARTGNRYVNRQGDFLYSSVFNNKTPVQIRFAALQATWEQKLGTGKLVAGWRSTLAITKNRFSFYNEDNNVSALDVHRSSEFRYHENIHALFGQYQQQFQKWSWQAGLRFEQTVSDGQLTARNPVAGQRVKRSYLNAFPSAGITYQLNTNNQVGLSFSRRIDRPSYQDLNPFENRLDELTYQKGNPFLRPQLTNNIELRNTYRNKFSTSLSFSDVQDFFAAITDTVEGRRNFIMQRNIASQKVYSLNASLPLKITTWWNAFANAGVNHSRYRAQLEPGKEIRINATVATIYQQHTFRISKIFTGEISSFYMSPFVWAGTYQCRHMWNIDIGVQCRVLQEQGTIKVSATDLFGGMPWKGTSQLGSLKILGAGGWESRQLRLNFSYRFGNKEVKAARQRKTSLEDLNQRVQ